MFQISDIPHLYLWTRTWEGISEYLSELKKKNNKGNEGLTNPHKYYRDMKRKTEFYFKVSEEYSKLEQKLGSELLLDEIFINIEINELTKVIKAIAVRNNIDINL